MPLKYQGREYEFEALVRHIMRKKKWPKARAQRYVGEIQKRQEKHK